ncbi:hypothetical protein [Winogradskyella pulchriflava]|uniref:Lipopolysaccharide biosynthesis protein n=1 Tax=Winogradskyella pulchriflava TaxID=1110688 RepID=A0ABV6Q574_9FLAO
MSEKLPQGEQTEEVDLGQLFIAIGKMFEKLFSFIGKVFRTLFSIIIYSLKPLVNNIKTVLVILMLAAIAGFIIEKLSKPVFVSSMLVKPYFDSKYQLANNVEYFNALIKAKDYNQLSKIFEFDSVVAKELIAFDIEIGPETPNDLLVEYDTYIKGIDSTLAQSQELTYESFIENRNVLSGSTFSITAESYKKDIFVSLDKGFEKTFKNQYSEKLKDLRDKSFKIKRETYIKQLERSDSLQQIYLQVLKTESEEGGKISIEGLLPMTKEKSVTHEYDLFNQEIRLRDSIRSLDEQLITKSDFYDVLSNFEDIGTPEKKFEKRYSILFPIIALTIIVLTFLFMKAFKFIKDYE